MVSNSGRPVFGVGGNRGNPPAEVTVNDNEWHQMVGVYEGKSTNKTLVYLDGNCKQMLPAGTIPETSVDAIWIVGKFPPEGGYLDADVDEIVVWNRALDPSEIKKLYDRVKSGLSLKYR